ncbi:MAG: ribonuclease / adenosylcobalamin/alpha-ribazole phosphatase [Actinomycetota bacterium]|nr:ribonuclease / adenosylcobalamin/alpha-ribazole phosphatase [Actinomycetota bacterium]
MRDGSGEIIGEVAESIGSATNNVAEYSALIAGLELALQKGITDLDVFLDSQLLVSQLKGEWKIKNDRLRTLAVKARSLLNRFDKKTIQHVPREQNEDADRLANQGMDAAMLDWDAERESPGQQSFLE